MKFLINGSGSVIYHHDNILFGGQRVYDVNHGKVFCPMLQWTDRQWELADSMLTIRPYQYRVIKADGKIKSKCSRPSVMEMNRVDPSEAVRSADILRLLPDYFQILERKPVGGTILQLLLENIVGNFNPDHAPDMRLLHLIFDLKDFSLETGDINSDFAAVIALKKVA